MIIDQPSFLFFFPPYRIFQEKLGGEYWLLALAWSTVLREIRTSLICRLITHVKWAVVGTDPKRVWRRAEYNFLVVLFHCSADVRRGERDGWQDTPGWTWQSPVKMKMKRGKEREKWTSSKLHSLALRNLPSKQHLFLQLKMCGTLKNDSFFAASRILPYIARVIFSE